MEAHTQQDMSEEQLRKIERVAIGHELELITEVRRLRQRETDLSTAATLWEGLYKDKTEKVRQEGYIAGWQDCEERLNDWQANHEDYARGVRVP